MHILVIGGTRFIGPPTVRALHDLGHDVTVYHRGEHEPDLPGSVRHVHSPLARFPTLEFPAELRDSTPDIVLHMVPLGERDARALMDAFHGVARRVVGISSADVYRAYDIFRRVEDLPPDPVPLTEDSPLRDRLYPYRGMIEDMDDYEKILAERVILGDPALPGTILRLPFVYGPGDGQHRFFPWLKRMDDERPAIIVGEAEALWRSSWCYVDNVAGAIALACTDDRAAGRIYNVDEEPPPSRIEWIRQIGEAAGWSGEIVAVPQAQLPAHLADSYNWVQEWMDDSSRIRRELGYREPVSIDEALRRTVAWERANPPAEIDPAQFDYEAEDRVLSS